MGDPERMGDVMRDLREFWQYGGGPMRDTDRPVDGASFTCPVCGAQGEEISFAVEADIIEVLPTVALWEGGPVVPDYGAPPECHIVDNTLTTSVCGCSFQRSKWDVVFKQYANRPGELVVTPKPLTS